MSSGSRFDIAVLAGDGIGPEVTAPCLQRVEQVAALVGGFQLEFVPFEAGAGNYERTGQSIQPDDLKRASSCKAILLAAMGLPSVRYPDGTEIAPQLELREALHLYAGVRPVRAIVGLPRVLADVRAESLDLVLVRESTEGLFAARHNTRSEGDEAVHDTMVITRATCERLFDFAFELARKRKQQGKQGRVTCVDKANVLSGFAFFRRIFDERAERYPDVVADYSYVDAMGLNLVKRPWEFDVLVTENMFGDILSDIGAGIVGGMGVAPSADFGDQHAVFQPCHGSAPDIAGQGKANPTAMFLSAAMMLEWLGDRHGNEACSRAGQVLDAAVREAFRAGKILPVELGGTSGTAEVSAAVEQALQSDTVARILS